MGDAESPELHSIDASVVEGILSVEEDFFQAAFLLGKAGCSSLEPAVAELTLADVVGGNAIAEQCSLWEIILGSFPLKVLISPLVCLSHVSPG